MLEYIQVQKISDTLYILNENITDQAAVTMALVIGSEKAAIIDTGFGLTNNLTETIKTITDKPCICLITHGDPDHVGGAPQFKDVYMSQLDDKVMKSSIKINVRLKVLENSSNNPDIINYVRKNLVRKEQFSYKNIEDGDIFDLGGIKLEAISLGGHTKGSMCFLNRKGKYAITGDSIANVNASVLIFKKCMPLAAYRVNLSRFVDRVGEDITIYTGHDVKPLKQQVIPEIITLCNEILEGKTEGDRPYLPPFMKSKDAPSNPIAAIGRRLLMGVIVRMQLGNSKPLTHGKKGFIGKVRYNGNKIT